MSLREQKKAVLRNTLVRNAMTLLRDRAYDTVSLDEIVAASMCSRSTFHRYFGTKEDLLFPTADARLRMLKTSLRSAKNSDDPWMVVRREATAALCGFLEDIEPEIRSRCIALWFDEPTPRRRYFEIVMEWEGVLLAFLERRLADSNSQILELQLLACSITSALRAALNTAMRSSVDVREQIDRAFDLIESGASTTLLALREASSNPGLERDEFNLS